MNSKSALSKLVFNLNPQLFNDTKETKDLSKNEQNNANNNIPKTVSIMLKAAFEELIKKNRIENFDNDQDFVEIKKKYSKTKLFTDSKFKTNNESIFYSSDFEEWLQNERKSNSRKEIVWRRAKDISANAKFAVDDAGDCVKPKNLNESNYKNYFHTTDLDQGCLGNCWFISAATGIIQNYSLFKRVVPFDNSFDDDSYTGAFHFRFWIFGTWKDVVIDDYLPVGSDNKLIFCQNKENPNEFWCALLEKAYAKVCGSYEALEGGFTTDALIDMSGGVAESYSLKEIRELVTCNNNTSSNSSNSDAGQSLDKNTFWDLLDNAERKCSVIGCNIDSNDESAFSENRLSNGLVLSHAYVVTKVYKIELKNETSYNLIRLYNPWGNDVEWNGDWSDKSSKWSLIDEETRKKLDVKDEKDGEFWMSYDDWLKNFDHCQICNLTPETICDISDNDWENQRLMSSIFSLWQCQYFSGKWIKNVSAGGRGFYDKTKFFQNPQYGFVLTKSDMIRNNSCWVIIALMQKFTRKKLEHISFRLFKAINIDTFNQHMSSGKSLDSIHLQKINSSGPYINKREITRRFSLEPGAYIIIPSTYEENIEGEFMLRVFTEIPVNYKCLNEPQLNKMSVLKPVNHNGHSNEAKENMNIPQPVASADVNSSSILSSSMLIDIGDKIAALAMIFGGIVPYLPQYRMIYRSKNSSGFSTFVCLALLLANILRLLFWLGHPFEMVLVYQSIVMIVCMIVMLELCIRLRDTGYPNVVKKFSDFDLSHFWKWNDFSSYIQFLALFCLFGSALTKMLIDVSIYVEILGYLAVFTEAMLGVPQFYRNFINKSTDGMSISMVLMWTSGDLFKTLYFILKSSPTQFWVCGMLQVSIDLSVLYQVYHYSKRKY